MNYVVEGEYVELVYGVVVVDVSGLVDAFDILRRPVDKLTQKCEVRPVDEVVAVEVAFDELEDSRGKVGSKFVRPFDTGDEAGGAFEADSVYLAGYALHADLHFAFSGGGHAGV